VKNLEAVRPPWLVTALFVFAAGWAFVPGFFRPPRPAIIGRAAPDMELLASTRGKVAVLAFWSSWCEPCATEIPIVDRVAKKTKGDVVFLAVDTSDERAKAEAWLRQHPLEVPVVFDTDDRVARAFEVNNLPTIVTVSRRGTIVDARLGLDDEAELERMIRDAR
jgi:thiol-disulfide isomerase/thioredoxin